jgi:hypothetical protein
MHELTPELLIDSEEGMDRMGCCLTGLEAHFDDSALQRDISRGSYHHPFHTIEESTGFLGFKRLESWLMPERTCAACCATETPRSERPGLRSRVRFSAASDLSPRILRVGGLLAPVGVLFLGSTVDPDLWTVILAGAICHFRPRSSNHFHLFVV